MLEPVDPQAQEMFELYWPVYNTVRGQIQSLWLGDKVDSGWLPMVNVLQSTLEWT